MTLGLKEKYKDIWHLVKYGIFHDALERLPDSQKQRVYQFIQEVKQFGKD